MKRGLSTCLIVLAFLTAPNAWAQEGAPGPGTFDVTIIPGGGTFLLKGNDTGEPAFGNYDVGGAVAVNFNQYVALEGEVSGSIGVSQNLKFLVGEQETKSPNMLQYSGNVLVYAPTGMSIVPYLTAGIGGLNLFDKATLGIGETYTFLTGNAGGGVKWYSGRWGLRADYRFLAVRPNSEVTSTPTIGPRGDFFGKETRFGHRVYGGILVNIGS